jgi:MinD superfamily P-loop ATPase
MQIAVASGKGGTGKTTVAVNLCYFFAKYGSQNVHLVDCDVEEPNDVLFFNKPREISKKPVYQYIPEIETTACTFCKKCQDWCEFNAITIVKNRLFARINESLCHSCGACLEACKSGAITEKPLMLGIITQFETGIGTALTEGRLKVGSAMQTMLIKQLKNELAKNGETAILDTPPGTSCPVVETVSGTDYIILVTEPTPFGLHDLKITVELLKEMQKPFGVLVNKAGLGNDEVYRFLNDNSIELLGEIPFSKEYAAVYSSGKILENVPAELEETYKNLVERLVSKLAIR